MKNKKVLLVVLPIIIAVALYFSFKSGLSRKNREAAYSYTAYGVAEDGTIYTFGVDGPGLQWPVEYEGKKLKALYGCADCKHLFPAEPGAVTAQCPQCGNRNVGAYDEELHGTVEATKIRIEQPKRPERR